MGFSIEQIENGDWEWSCFQSSYGYVSGISNTLAKAKIELAIAEAHLFEAPYPPTVEAAMRADPERFAADWPDPPYKEKSDG